MKKLVYISLLLSCSFLQSAEIESLQTVQQTSKQDVSGGQRAIFSKFSQLPDELQLEIVKQADISPLQQLADQAGIFDAKDMGLLQTLWKGHQGLQITSVSWSPDAKYIASGSEDTTIRVWNAKAGKLLNTLGKVGNKDSSQGHIDFVTSVSWSPDGTYIASGSNDRTVRIWDAETGRLLKTLGKVGNKDSSQGHIDFVTSVSWSPDGTYIASGSWDRTVRIWDAETGRVLKILGKVNNKDLSQGHIDWVTSVSWSPDGTYIVSGSNDRTIRIWDAETGRVLKTLGKRYSRDLSQGHIHFVRSVSWSPTGTYIASGSNDRTVRIWDAETGRVLKTLGQGSIDWVTSVSWSPDGKYVVSASRDRTVRIWDAETGKLLETLGKVDNEDSIPGYIDIVNSVSWSPDGKYIAEASWGTTGRIWGQTYYANIEGNLSVAQQMLVYQIWQHQVLYQGATSQIFKIDLNADQFEVYTTLPAKVKDVLKHFIDEKATIRNIRIQRLSQRVGTREQKEEKE